MRTEPNARPEGVLNKVGVAIDDHLERLRGLDYSKRTLAPPDRRFSAIFAA
jgi:hypothetical protein